MEKTSILRQKSHFQRRGRAVQAAARSEAQRYLIRSGPSARHAETEEVRPAGVAPVSFAL